MHADFHEISALWYCDGSLGLPLHCRDVITATARRCGVNGTFANVPRFTWQASLAANTGEFSIAVQRLASPAPII